MKTGSWKDIAELVGIAAIVASLIFVGLELKQNRDLAIATMKDSTTNGYRELNFARMNADWYWQIAAKLTTELPESGPTVLGLPIATPQKWRDAIQVLSSEELGRFQSYHLQEKNEAQRMYELNKLGLTSDRENGLFLVRMRAPLWSAMFSLGDSEFNRLVLEELKKYDK